jgi:hypothetical protein
METKSEEQSAIGRRALIGKFENAFSGGGIVYSRPPFSSQFFICL